MKNLVLISMLLISSNSFMEDMREEAISERISSFASVCLSSDDCGIETSGPGYKVAINNNTSVAPSSANKVKLSEGSVHEVKMLNA